MGKRYEKNKKNVDIVNEDSKRIAEETKSLESEYSALASIDSLLSDVDDESLIAIENVKSVKESEQARLQRETQENDKERKKIENEIDNEIEKLQTGLEKMESMEKLQFGRDAVAEAKTEYKTQIGKYNDLIKELEGTEFSDNGISGASEEGTQGTGDSVVKEIIDGEEYYYDDNGVNFRVGNSISPNTSYTINGYTYQSDDLGRIVSAEGTLHVKDREGRLPIRDSLEEIGKGYEREGDDRGHLIGDQFDGSNGLENMVPQDATINRIDFKNFENELAKEVKENKNVTVRVEPVYENDSRRPSSIAVAYSIDGDMSIRVFPNE